MIQKVLLKINKTKLGTIDYKLLITVTLPCTYHSVHLLTSHKDISLHKDCITK